MFHPITRCYLRLVTEGLFLVWPLLLVGVLGGSLILIIYVVSLVGGSGTASPAGEGSYSARLIVGRVTTGHCTRTYLPANFISMRAATIAYRCHAANPTNLVFVKPSDLPPFDDLLSRSGPER